MPENVYLIKADFKEPALTINTKLEKILKEAKLEGCVRPNDLTGIKIHFGEDKNNTHIPSFMVRPVSEMIRQKNAKPFLTDTCVLYKSRRDNAPDHLRLAQDHGFTIGKTGAPVVIADGLLGGAEKEVKISGEIFKSVFIAETAMQANSLIVMTHVTGHLGTGMGGAIKNLGMGCASRKGKLRQHSVMKPSISETQCTLCGECVKWCPEEAVLLTEKSARIDGKLCIGCGECLTVCRFNAVKYDWKMSNTELQKRMAEHALGVTAGKAGRIGYINVLMNLTKDCDCIDKKQTVCMNDIGILAGMDPVAVDQASLDLIREHAGGKPDSVLYTQIDAAIQIKHAQSIGLGKSDYSLKEIH